MIVYMTVLDEIPIMENLIITRAEIGDTEKILNLQKMAYRSEAEIYNDYTLPPLTQNLDEIKADYDKQVFLKAIVNMKIVGSVRAFMEERTCYIGRLIVHPDFQNRGIGRALLRRAEERGGEKGLHKVFMHTSVKNLGMMNFASRNGFTFAKYLTEFWGQGTGDAFLLVRELL